MEVNSKRIVVWCGAAANQRALANKIHKQFGVAGIVIDKKKTFGKKKKQTSFLTKAWDHLRFRQITNAWTNLQQFYESRFKHWPEVPLLEVDTINSKEAQEFTNAINPHLVVVSGTALIKEAFLNLSVPIGIMNLHTGLSPYVKGGPNCTNWCIANNDWHLIGNTIMWINAGIDTGNIITSQTVDVTKCTSLFKVHLTVMEQAHELYLKAINYVLHNPLPYISIPQKDLGEGKLYLTRMWTAEAKKRLLQNWRKRNHNKSTTIVKVVTLP